MGWDGVDGVDGTRMRAPQATSHEIAAVTRTVADAQTIDYHTSFLYLMRSLMSYDFRVSHEVTRMGALSRQSQRILSEYAVRYRIGLDYQAVAYVAYAQRTGRRVALACTCAERAKSPRGAAVRASLVETVRRLALLSAAYVLMTIDLSELAAALSEAQSLVRQSVPLTLTELSTVGRCEEMLYVYLKAQLLKYSQTFPYAKPEGVIEAALGILVAIYNDPIFVKRNPDAAKESAAAAVRTLVTVRIVPSPAPGRPRRRCVG